MKTKEQTSNQTRNKKNMITLSRLMFMTLLGAMFFISTPASAHCDSYDGPVIKEALKALETNNVKLVYKWITAEQEDEITGLFNKTYELKNGDKEVYAIVEKHFLETLVRLHREMEGASFTGIKPAGSMTPLVEMADNSLATAEVDNVVNLVTTHLGKVLRERYEKAMELSKTKDVSPEKGREYVHAYIQYTHTLEAMEHLLHGDHAH